MSMRKYSPSTGSVYLPGVHASMPDDCIDLPDVVYQQVIANPPPGAIRGHDASGLPVLLERSEEQRLSEAQGMAWARIRAERERRVQDGGFKVGDHWFHGDTFSRSQHLGLKDQARDVLARGGADDDPLLADGEPVLWKTMGGDFVLVTVRLAFAIVQAATDSDARIFKAAEWHRAQMMASADPAGYDHAGGWPAAFGE